MNENAIDPADLRILRQLQQNARISNVDLAEACALSTSACHRRLQAIEVSGLVRSYGAVLDREKMGFGLVVFVEIALASKDPDTARAFQQAVMARAEVLECHIMTGEYDYLLRIAVPDIPTYRRLIMEELLSLPGVDKSRSAISLGEVKYSTALPI